MNDTRSIRDSTANAGTLGREQPTWRRWFVPLLKKELLQLLPLTVILAGVVLVFGVAVTALFPATPASPLTPAKVSLAIPLLIALGAGTVSVTTEVETKSIGLLSWLPVPSASIVLGKWFTATMLIAACWLAILCLAAPTLDPMGWKLLGRLIPQSLFILTLSMTCGWVFRESMPALLSMIPLSLVPTAFAFAVIVMMESITGRGLTALDEDRLHQLAVWLAIPVSFLLMVTSGTQTLTQGESSLHLGRLFHRDFTVKEPSSESKGTWRAPFRSPNDALIWQATHQQPRTFWVLSLLAIASITVIASVSTMSSSMQLTMLRRSHSEILVLASVLIGLLCWSFLGVMASAGKNSPAGLRILTQMGVSPTRIWITRWIPVASMAALALVVYAAATQLSAQILGTVPNLFSWLMILLFLAAWIGLSGWTASVVRPLTAAIVAAPIVTAAIMAWWGQALWMLPTGIIWFAVGIVVAWISCWWLHRLQSDGQRGKSFWAAAGWTFVLLMTMPLCPIWLTMVQSAPHGNAAQWKREGDRYAATMPPRTILLNVVDSVWFVSDEEPTRSVQAILDHAQRETEAANDSSGWFATLDQQPQARLHLPHAGTIDHVAGLLHRQGLIWRQNPRDPETLESLQRQLTRTDRLAARFRDSATMEEQEFADVLEIAIVGWLIEVRDSSASWTDFALEVRRRISDRENRAASRRRALLVDYAGIRRDLETDPSAAMHGRMLGQRLFRKIPAIGWTRVARGRLDETVANFLTLIDSQSSSNQRLQARQRLHGLYLDSNIDLNRGPYATGSTIDDAILYGADPYPGSLIPGTRIGGEWERQAEQLWNGDRL